MAGRFRASVAVFVLTFALADEALAQVTRDQLGRSVKLKILVDKVMQPTAGWHTEEWMVRTAAEAGFNVWSPRHGFNDFTEVRQVTQWCAKYGIFHMPWMRGTLGVGKEHDATGKMVVWENGGEQPLWSPNSDEFWDWTTKYVVEYAKMSEANDHIMGVFLDYENYAKGPRGSGMLYFLSYDDLILRRFAASKEIELPADFSPAARKPWLVEKGLHDAFEAFQVAHWRERCRTLREAVDRHAPWFQFCMYPAPGSPFMLQAALPEWTSNTAPVILADASTYGRVTRFLPEPSALTQNRNVLSARMKGAKDLGMPVIYSGGIDPIVRGADPEFCGKNAVMISDVTDGYWIFYEGPKYDVDHPDYWHWFTWANAAIDKADWAAQHQARETEDPWAFSVDVGKGGIVPPPAESVSADMPVVSLRRTNMLLVSGTAGVPVELSMTIRKIGSNTHDLTWEARDLTWASVAEGTVPFDGGGTIRFTPAVDAMFLLLLRAGGSAYHVARANTPIGLVATEGLSVIGDPPPLYFHVPQGVKSFTTYIRGGSGIETVRLDVHAPDGRLVATGQTTPSANSTTVSADVGGDGGRIWSLDLGKADEGVIEDIFVRLDNQLPPTLSSSPALVFRKSAAPR